MLFIRFLLCFSWIMAYGPGPACSQDIQLSGSVQAQDSRHPLPFVNIGIRGKNTGTVADEDGRFTLRIPAARAHDTLTFSAIGYQERAFPLAQLTAAQLQPVLLTEKATALAEVVVRGRAQKVHRVGTTSHNPLLWGSVRNKDSHDINEFAKLISLGPRPGQLEQVHIFLRRPTVDTVTFRLNFYCAADGQPGERLVEQTILVRTASQNGWLTIDLTKYALTLQGDIYLSFEFLPEKASAAPAFSYGAQFGGAALVRTSSLGTWRREPGATLAAYVTVRQ